MVECDFCEEEFDDKKSLHIHWGEEHEEELNSHQKEKVKKAQRKKDEEKIKERKKKKDLAFKGLVSVLGLALAVLIIPQLLSVSNPDTSTGKVVDFNPEGQPMLGSENASVTMIEFGDYYCPACKAFKDTVMPQIKENYIETGKVKFYYYDFPLEIHNPQATRASEAAQCVYNQDQEEFWNYHDALYQNQRGIQYDTEGLMTLARSSTEGLDYESLRTCISTGETNSAVQSDLQKALDSGATGTPSIYVNGEKIPSTKTGYQSLSTILDKELESNE